MIKKLRDIYYSTNGYWKGWSAIDQLSKASGVDKITTKQWLVKQAVWQIYLPPPKYIPRPKFDVHSPNTVHQADLLFLTHDKVGRKTYKYCFSSG